jgi:peptidyl-prolyl cis-trans isomerase SurA
MTDLRQLPPFTQGRRRLAALSTALPMALSMALAFAGWTSPAAAQGFRLVDAPQVSPRIPGTRNLSTDLKLEGKQTTADYILAVVNTEPITHTDVDKRVSRILDTASRNTRLPSPEDLRKQVLEALINEKIQMQRARDVGIVISDAEIDNAIGNIATQNQISLDELQTRMKQDGLDYERYRTSVREQLLLERVREREVNARIQISDAELDAVRAQAAALGRDVDLNLAHILLPLPEGAKQAVVLQAAQKAEEIRQRAASGANFADLAKQFSQDPNTKDSGGALGMRPASRLPELFTDAVKELKVGDVGKVVRSGAGFHVVKLIERENSAKASYTQQRARHILLRTSPQLSVQAAKAKLADVRKQIVGGQSSFAQMARQYSEDGSATKGGDLGWASPGQFVPEFETALTALQPGQVSEPIASRFGVHLIQLIERREVQLTDAQQRDAARAVLREQRFEAAYEEWANELRAGAFVDMRDE